MHKHCDLQVACKHVNAKHQYNKGSVTHTEVQAAVVKTETVNAATSDSPFVDNQQEWWRSLLLGLPLDERSVSTFACAILQQHGKTSWAFWNHVQKSDFFNEKLTNLFCFWVVSVY